MTSESPVQEPGGHEAGPSPLSPAQRRKLQQFYEFGQQKNKQGDFAYAHQMYEQCVAGDPSNLVYVDAMLANLRARYDNNKRKARLKSARTDFKKALSEKRWSDVLVLGLQLLGENPWDIPTLRGMAEACAARHFNEVELRYLKMALDANSKDADVNRHCAQSLTRMGQYDQAIACWHRVEELVPGKGEAPQKISELTLLKNRIAAGYVDDPAHATSSGAGGGSGRGSPGPAKGADPAKAPGTAKPAAAGANLPAASSNPSGSASGSPQASPSGEPRLSPQAEIQALEQAIQKKPGEVKLYLALAEQYRKLNRTSDEEKVLRRALQVSGNDLAVRERFEDSQIRRARQELELAEEQHTRQGTPEHQEVVQQKRLQLNRLELAVFQSRAERYPQDRGIRFELAVRLKRAGNFEAAANYFAEAAAEPKMAPSALIQQGECLQQLRQYQKALELYLQGRKSAEESRNSEALRLALYRTGVLAAGLKNWELARNSLSAVVELDPQFRDAKSRLDSLP
jgi:tetratricopeptide (TPR) repeat protein